MCVCVCRCDSGCGWFLYWVMGRVGEWVDVGRDRDRRGEKEKEGSVKLTVYPFS